MATVNHSSPWCRGHLSTSGVADVPPRRFVRPLVPQDALRLVGCEGENAVGRNGLGRRPARRAGLRWTFERLQLRPENAEHPRRRTVRIVDADEIDRYQRLTVA